MPETGPPFEEGGAMLTALIAMGLLVAAALTGAVVQFRRDGYGRTPTFPR